MAWANFYITKQFIMGKKLNFELLFGLTGRENG